jgi:guanidinoacetate N-methyltransferase
MQEDKSRAGWSDSRQATFHERLRIGFDNLREKWKTADANFSPDALTICGHPVMESWEDNYMKELAQIASSRGGKVLEVGFGLGISASYLQKQNISQHFIIEANEEVIAKAEQFARAARVPVKLLPGFWEDITPDLPTAGFSGILFDTYPLNPDEVHQNHFSFFEEAHRLLRPGGVLTYYSDEISNFSPSHLKMLRDSGFDSISAKLCLVNPPADCRYWKEKTILAPIIVR